MGLLDFNLDNLDSPQARMGLGLLAAAGPQAVPMSFGQRLAGAMGQMRAERAAEEERKARQQAQAMQAQLLQLQLEQSKRQKDLTQRRDNYLGALDPNAGPTIQPTMAGAMAAGLSPQEFVALNPQPKPADFKVVGNRLVEIGPSGVREAYAPPEKPDLNSLIVIGPDGKPTVNRLLLDAKRQIARDGASNINQTVNAEKPLLNTVATKLGEQLDASLSNAKAATQAISTAQSIKSAIDSGKVIAGPGSSFRVVGLQLGQMLGVGGNDSAEMLSNTRTVIQGLAKAELDAAQQMKGQGQITEAERDIIRRAASGNIDTMTGPEIRLLMDSMEKTARAKIGQHRANVQSLSRMEGAAPLIPFYQVDEPPMSGGWSIKPKP